MHEVKNHVFIVKKKIETNKGVGEGGAMLRLFSKVIFS